MRLSGSALLAATLCGLRATLQQAGRPEAGFSGPRLEARDFRQLRRRPSGAHPLGQQPKEPRAVVIGLHGMNDYAERRPPRGALLVKRPLGI